MQPVRPGCQAGSLRLIFLFTFCSPQFTYYNRKSFIVDKSLSEAKCDEAKEESKCKIYNLGVISADRCISFIFCSGKLKSMSGQRRKSVKFNEQK